MRTRRKSNLFWVLLVIMIVPMLSACSSNKIQTYIGDYKIRDFYSESKSGGTFWQSQGIGSELIVTLERADGKDLTSADLENMVGSGAFLTRENGSRKYEIPRYLRESKFTDVKTDNFRLEFVLNDSTKKGDTFILKWPGNEPIKLKLKY